MAELEVKNLRTASLEELGMDSERLADAFRAFQGRLGVVVGSKTTGENLSKSLWSGTLLKNNLEPEELELALGLRARFDPCRQRLSEASKALFPWVCQQFVPALTELEGKNLHTATLEELRSDSGRLVDAFELFQGRLGVVVGSKSTGQNLSKILWSGTLLEKNFQREQLQVAQNLRARFLTLKTEIANRRPIGSYGIDSGPAHRTDRGIRPKP